jgi:hypothetical protein
MPTISPKAGLPMIVHARPARASELSAAA